MGGNISDLVIALCMTTYWKYYLVGFATYFILSNSSNYPSSVGIFSKSILSIIADTAIYCGGVDLFKAANWKCLISSVVGKEIIQKHYEFLDLCGNNIINLGAVFSLPTNLAMATFLVAMSAITKAAKAFYYF